MSYNGSGTFVINTAGQPVVSGTVISSTAFNALTADLATGLSTAITKDGQTTPTANIPMGNNKITGLAAGTAATDAANLSQVQSTAAKLINSISGADTITGTLSPTLTAYAAGQMFYFVAAGDNTGAVTLNINSLGAKSVTRDGTTALAAGDIQSGEVCVIVYDGTQFQLVNGASQSASIVTENLTVNKATVLNESGGNNDTRIEGDTDQNLVFVDASADAVGIGTSSPGAKLEVNTSGNGDGLWLRNSTTNMARLYRGTSGTNPGVLDLYASDVIRVKIDGEVGAVSYFNAGNVGIGTSSPTQPLHVDASGGGVVRVTRLGTSATAYGQLENDGTNSSVSTTGALIFNTGSSPAERARITSGGDLLVGTTTANSGSNVTIGASGGGVLALQRATGTTTGLLGEIRFGNENVDGKLSAIESYQGGATDSSDLRFYTSPTGGSQTERARITSDGYSKFSNDGTYFGSTSSYHEFRQTAADTALVITPTNASFASDGVFVRTTRAANSAFNFYVANANGTTQFYVRGDGVLFAQNTTIQSLSDGRLKENVRTSSEGLSVINALRPVRYDWKEGFGNDRKDQLGFIAQEVEAVFPEAVSEWKASEGEETYKTVGPAAMIPVLVKAIQEQQAMINELKAKVAALETK